VQDIPHKNVYHVVDVRAAADQARLGESAMAKLSKRGRSK
jgi:hypothetical protein